jgi:hypothetical protein
MYRGPRRDRPVCVICKYFCRAHLWWSCTALPLDLHKNGQTGDFDIGFTSLQQPHLSPIDSKFVYIGGELSSVVWLAIHDVWFSLSMDSET